MSGAYLYRLLIPFLFLQLFYTPEVKAQSETHDFITYDTVLNLGYANAYWVMRITRPRNMFTAGHPDTASRPVIINMNGIGEIGSNANLTANYGPHYWLNHGWDGGIQLGNGKHYPIIISVQWHQAWPSPYDVHWVIDHILNTYHVKKNSVHLCGLSMGAMAWTAAIGYEMIPGDEYDMKKITSIVALQGEATTGNDSLWGKWAKKYNGKFFGLEGTGDYRRVWGASVPMNDSMPGSAYFSYETLGGGTHCCWNTMYDPARTNWTCVGTLGPDLTVGSPANTMGTYKPGDYIFKWMLKQGDTTLIEAGPIRNLPPVAVAGPDQSIILPASSVTLNGSLSSDDHAIVSYQWTKLTGTGGTLATPNAAITTFSGLTSGTYTVELKVTDDSSAVTRDTVQINVSAYKLIPGLIQAESYDAQSGIQTETTTDTGGGLNVGWFDPSDWLDYTVSVLNTGNYTVNFRVASPNTGVSFQLLSGGTVLTTVNVPQTGGWQAWTTVAVNIPLTAGVQTLRILSNSAGWNFNWMNFSIAAGNIPPVSNAGTDQTIQLPANTVTLNGSGTDVDGTVSTYAWTKISGPATYTIASPAAATTAINGLVQGVYVFRLTVTDNQGATGFDDVQVTVNAANVAPTANAGADKVIQLPTSTVTITGSGTDPDGSIVSYAWTKISGPATYTIASPVAAVTAINGLVQGVYVFRLTVTDNQGATGFDDVQITVNAANVAPTANAGADKVIQLPTNTVTVNGSGTDTDGSIATYAWTKVSGPATYTIASPAAATTAINGLVQGVYVFRLTVTDNQGATGFDDVQVTVNAANIAPTANAGADQNIQLPVNTVTLNGSGTDADGSVSTYAWTKISGPATYTITSPAAATTTINGLVQGVYVFRLTVTDNQGATGFDDVQVTVNAANIAPTANAGADQNIQLPVNTVTLNGSGTDADGSVSSYAWTKISGPATYTIASPAAATTAINGLVQGVYVFRLTVTDNQGATGFDDVQVTVNAANIAPTANAGADQTIQLPVNTVTVNGSGTDADGSVSSYAWTKISGPATYTIASPAAATTAINGLVQGVYVFRLTVTDNQGATGFDDVQVTVNAANIAPTANAGADQTIQLPANTVTVNGSGTDADGTITTYAWTKISGPAAYSITNPAAAGTVINGLAQGTYIFRLTVTDNQGATGFDDVQITVNGANLAPSANAGTDQVIQLPLNNVNVSGSGNDPDGSIAAYSWAYISGPAAYAITSPSAAATTINGLTQGTYIFRLTVTDNQGATGTDDIQITVLAANVGPVANAGADQNIQLPVNSVTVNGSGSDADGSVATYAWTKVSGPATYTIVSPASATTAINGLVQGIYVFRLTVTDNQGATGYDDVQITVAAPNVPPTAYAGADQSIQLPVNTVTVNGSGSDADGSVATYAWTKISGPATYTIVSPAAATTVINGLVQGVYVFRLTVTDNQGATGYDDVQITVAAPNVPPTANAGADQNIQLPVNTVTVNGSGSDADGSVATYAWTKVSGPATYTIVSPAAATTVINGLVQGVYVFRLTVTDNQSATGYDDVQITITAPNVPPTANAGADQIIQLPVNTVTVNGNGSDADGSVATYAWTKISGPATYTIVSPAAATTVINGLVQGVYVFRLTVTDNQGATGYDDVQITVNAANIAPTANAGPDQIIQFPTNTVTLTGTGSDPDGTIAAYQWTKIAGPSTYTIVSPAQGQTIINNLVQGVYQFELKVTDNQGATGKDTVTVTVNPANNINPIANAGADQVIQLPLNHVTLQGSGVDPDGTITGYLWNKIAGPAGSNIINAGSASTNVTGLVQGVYQFELTVTDNSGAIAKDTMIVTVNAQPNQPPTANAGADQTIQLPVNSVTVNGSGTDPDGNIASYSWTRISGPSAYTIVNATNPGTYINNLVQGVYQFELKVTDNNGATATDTVQITVLANVNQPPVANAGYDQNIMLPVNSVRLNGSGTDPDGTITTYQWTRTSGPANYTITSPAAATTDVTNLVQGIYQFVLTVTDNSGATATDTVYVIVNPATQAPNVPPTVHAGNDLSITLPVSYFVTQASASDPDGTITNYQWTKVDGPLVYTIVSPTQAQTEIRDLIPGHYSFELKVTDNRGAVARDTMFIDVADGLMVYGSIFPSPAKNKVNVSINAAVTSDKTIITIFDIHGQPMVRDEFTRNSQTTVRQYDVSRWAKGYYLVEIRLSDSDREVKRFVVQ